MQGVDAVLFHGHFCVLDLREPLRIGFIVLISLVFDHPVSSNADVGSGNFHTVQCYPVVNVVIFSPPAPVLVGETVYLQELSFTQPRDSAKVPRIGQPEAKLVHGNGKMARLLIAVIEIAVIHRNEIHITEDETVVLGVLHGLQEADIQEFGAIEGLLTELVDDIDAVAHLLPAQNGVEVVQPVFQVVVPVSEWNDNGHSPLWQAITWGVLSSIRHVRVLPLDPLHGHRGAKLDQQTTDQTCWGVQAWRNRLLGDGLVEFQLGAGRKDVCGGGNSGVGVGGAIGPGEVVVRVDAGGVPDIEVAEEVQTLSVDIEVEDHDNDEVHKAE